MARVFREISGSRLAHPSVLAKALGCEESEVEEALETLVIKGYLKPTGGACVDGFDECTQVRLWNDPDTLYACTKKGRALLKNHH